MPPDHIVGFYGSFMRHGTCNLILEHADQGTLRDFMSKNDPPAKGEEILTFWRSVLRLLVGLQTLHEAGEGEQTGSQFMSR